jgi:hypothetical protein
VKLEKKSYGPESTEEERLAIAGRVTLISEDMVLWKETPIQSVLSVDLMGERLLDLTKDLKSYSRVVDLSDVARPDAQVRRRLRQMIAAEDRLQHIALFTAKNILINVAIKFLFSGIAKNVSISVHESYEQAVDACRACMKASE